MENTVQHPAHVRRAALAFIFVILFTTFGSVRQALLVLSNIPFALVGGIVALWVTGEYLSVPASVGFIALLGIAVLNGVVMVTYFNQLLARGMPVGEVVVEGAKRRLRPVLLHPFGGVRWLGRRADDVPHGRILVDVLLDRLALDPVKNAALLAMMNAKLNRLIDEEVGRLHELEAHRAREKAVLEVRRVVAPWRQHYHRRAIGPGRRSSLMSGWRRITPVAEQGESSRMRSN